MSRTERVMEAALRLEAMLPKVMAVFRYDGNDPLAQVPVGQLRLLRSLFAGPRTATDLAGELGLSPSALTQMTQRLMRAGLVLKRDDPLDGRLRWLDLSDGARRLMERRRASRANALAKVLAEMSDDRIEVLLGVLEDLLPAPVPIGPARERALL